MAQTKIENFLTDKLRSEIETFGDGNTEFHTRDLEALLGLLDEKNEVLSQFGDQIKASNSGLELLGKNFEQFVKLTEQMRAAQVRYFKNRSSSDLADARQLEIKVDQFIKNWK